MRKNVAEVMKNPGTALPLEFLADMSDIEMYGERIFPDPVRISGEIRNRAGLVMVEADIHAVGRASCTRCLEPAEFVCDIPLDLTVTENAENAELEDYVYVEGDMLDLHGVVRDELILSCDMVILCQPDCRGLCSRCGKNLNAGDCDCAADEIDPRLAGLAELLKRQQERKDTDREVYNNGSS